MDLRIERARQTRVSALRELGEHRLWRLMQDEPLEHPDDVAGAIAAEAAVHVDRLMGVVCMHEIVQRASDSRTRGRPSDGERIEVVRIDLEAEVLRGLG